MNVCIYRIPRNLSLVYPSSHCPQCKNKLRAVDLIPVLSYLFFRGRCRYCKKAIPWRYPVVELICGLSFLVLAYKYGFTMELLLYLVFACGLMICSFVDIDLKIIPDQVLLFTVLVGGFLIFAGTQISILERLLGALVGSSLFIILALIFEGGMGGGDIKLIAVIGFYLGWQNTLLTIGIASLLGLVVTLIIAISKKTLQKTLIPFGPYLSLGAVIALLWGENIIKIILRM